MSTFSSSLQGPFLLTFPNDLVKFFQASRYKQFLHIAFVHEFDKNWGRWLTVNPKNCDYQSSIGSTLVNVTNTTRLYRDSIKRDKLE